MWQTFQAVGSVAIFFGVPLLAFLLFVCLLGRLGRH